jgi:hypothetical protein
MSRPSLSASVLAPLFVVLLDAIVSEWVQLTLTTKDDKVILIGNKSLIPSLSVRTSMSNECG